MATILAAYLGVRVDDVAFRSEAGGKPQLVPDSDSAADACRLEFNWSHSGDYALIAIARGLPLGVDIEYLGKQPRVLEIARRYFDPGEAEALAGLQAEARRRAFIALWCAKESVLKACGEGLSFGLARLAFQLGPQHAWQLARTDAALGAAGEWQLAGFSAAPHYRGALAWRGGMRRVAAFRAPA